MSAVCGIFGKNKVWKGTKAAMEKPLFTVVIAHYNQLQYLDQAVQSVLFQNWPNIELIIADDASSGVDWDEKLSAIRAQCGQNVTDCRLCGGETNVGTVRNLNRAAKNAKGRYILFFAADDALYDENVLAGFADALEKMPPDGLCATAQCLMMDERLETDKDGLFTQVTDAVALNQASAWDQYRRLAKSAFYAMGCSAMRTADFAGEDIFDTSYRLLEDWPFFLQHTRQGKKVYFTPFLALRHRDGGISHNTDAIRPAYVSGFMKELLQVYEKELLPHMGHFSIALQNEIMERYFVVRRECAGEKMLPMKTLYWQHKKLFARRSLWKMLAHYPRWSRAAAAFFLKTFLLWITLGSLGIQFIAAAPALKMAYIEPLLLFLIKWLCPAALAASLAVFLLLQLFRAAYQIRLAKK